MRGLILSVNNNNNVDNNLAEIWCMYSCLGSIVTNRLNNVLIS